MRLWTTAGLLVSMLIPGLTKADNSLSPNERGYFGYVATYESTASGEGQIHVLEVHEGGPAQATGLREGDRIYRVNGKVFVFENDLDMIRQLTSIPPGETLTLDWIRQGKALKGTLRVGIQPETNKRDLGQWMERAEAWFEQGGAERCRLNQEQWRIYRDLEERTSEEGLSLEMVRPKESHSVVSFVTADGERLALARLQNTFLEALSLELPIGQSWKLRVHREEHGIGGAVLVVVPQEGPRAGQRGLLLHRGLRETRVAAAE